MKTYKVNKLICLAIGPGSYRIEGTTLKCKIGNSWKCKTITRPSDKREIAKAIMSFYNHDLMFTLCDLSDDCVIPFIYRDAYFVVG